MQVEIQRVRTIGVTFFLLVLFFLIGVIIFFNPIPALGDEKGPGNRAGVEVKNDRR